MHRAETAPSGPSFDAALAVDVGVAHIDGAFPEMAAANAAFVAAVAHQHLALGQLYGAARALEQAYARDGYILVRVIVPPQRILSGGPVNVVVIDGYVEQIDVSQLSVRIRQAVANRLQPLVGKGHITQGRIERALLLAGDLAGVHIRSAIAPGSKIGGVKLIAEAEFTRVDGQLGGNNALPASLGRWQFTGNMALNSPLGLGDELYLSAGSQLHIGRYGFPKSALGMIGFGYVMPLDNSGTTWTSEFLTSRTQPQPIPDVPESVGNYSRGLFRLSWPIIRTRPETLVLTNTFEIITQSEKLPAFSVQVSRDHYWAWRLGMAWQKDLEGVPLAVDAVLSQGLAGRVGTTALPTSRRDASSDFTNFEMSSHATIPVASGFALDLVVRGKTGFGRPLLLSEQFALDAANGVSSFPGGSFNVDSGITIRSEFRYPGRKFGSSLTLAPYLFGARGWGWVSRPTAVEQGVITAAAAGLGTKIFLDTGPLLARTAASISIECGHQFSNVSGRENGERIDLSAALQF